MFSYFVLVLIVMSFSMISSFSLSSFLNPTGNAVEGIYRGSCFDSDGGMKPGIVGITTVNGNDFYDSCVFNRPGEINESFCTAKGRAATRIASCYPGNICYGNACRSGCQVDTVILSSSTTLTKILKLSLPTERISITLSSVLPQSNQAKLSLSPASTPSAIKVLDLSKGSINYFTLQSGRELKIELISLIETTGGDKKATVRVTSCKIPEVSLAERRESCVTTKVMSGDSLVGGTFYTKAAFPELGEGSICKFLGSSCPAGWAQKDSWSTTTPGVYDDDESSCITTIFCGSSRKTCDLGAVSTGSHWFSNIPIESAQGDNTEAACHEGSCTKTCVHHSFRFYANVIAVGCYKL